MLGRNAGGFKQRTRVDRNKYFYVHKRPDTYRQLRDSQGRAGQPKQHEDGTDGNARLAVFQQNIYISSNSHQQKTKQTRDKILQVFIVTVYS